MSKSNPMNRSNFIIKALIALVTVFLTLVAAKVYFRSSETMNRSAEEAVSALESGEHLVLFQTMKETPDESLALIDLRSDHQYRMGHLEGAINIPMRSLEQSTQRDLIIQAVDSGKKVLLYAESMYDAEGAWLLLYQMGLDGMQVLQIDVHSAAEELKVSEHTDAVPLDYAARYKKLSTKPVEKVKTAPVPKKTVQPVQKKKKKAPEGGC